jgi:glycosyltransferase involved in cell wall biosynthesis
MSASMGRRVRWAILTGEYPPQPGGVADYTALVARGLAAAGDGVTVFAPPHARRAEPAGPGVAVVRLPDHYGPRGLVTLDRTLARLRPDRVLVQYVPHAYGCKAMNVPLCLWLARQRRLPVWVMFHEVAFPLRRGQPLTHSVVGCVTHLMAWLVRRAAERTFVSTLAWGDLLRRLGPGPIEWLPVPSNLPEEVEPGQVAAARARLAPVGASLLLGHFGTFGANVAPLLAGVLPPLLLADPRRRAVLVGRHSEVFARGLESEHPNLAGRLVATGGLPPAEVAASLAACDVLLQPYPDGATARRTTLMSGLALGRPIVTTMGRLTEPLWREQALAAMSPADDPQAFIAAVEELSADPDARRALGEQGRTGYLRYFSLEKTVRTLRGMTCPAGPKGIGQRREVV